MSIISCMRVWEESRTQESVLTVMGWGTYTYSDMCRFFNEKRFNEDRITALCAERESLLQRIEELEDTAFTDNEYISHLENQ